MEDEKKELLSRRVPVECPFCRNVDDVEWSEFKVLLADVGYVVRGEWKRTVGFNVNVFCTRCEEEVREEDI